MKPDDLLRHRGLTEDEIFWVLGGGTPAFNILSPPRFGPDRCFLVFFPDQGTYFLGHGDGPIWGYVSDTNYAVMWTAQGKYSELEKMLTGERKEHGIEFRV